MERTVGVMGGCDRDRFLISLKRGPNAPTGGRGD